MSWSTGSDDSEGCGDRTGVTPLLLYRNWIVETAKKFNSPFVPLTFSMAPPLRIPASGDRFSLNIFSNFDIAFTFSILDSMNPEF